MAVSYLLRFLRLECRKFSKVFIRTRKVSEIEEIFTIGVENKNYILKFRKGWIGKSPFN
jgi:hypothetical protein